MFFSLPYKTRLNQSEGKKQANIRAEEDLTGKGLGLLFFNNGVQYTRRN